MAFLTQQMNVLQQSPIIGLLDMLPAPSVVPCQINPASVATAIQVGSVMKIVTGTSGGIVVDVGTGATDGVVPFGVIPYNERINIYTAGQFIELATGESYVYLLSGGAIARGASVSYTPATVSVDPTVISDVTSGHQEIGFAVDAATAANQLIRVRIAPFTHV